MAYFLKLSFPAQILYPNPAVCGVMVAGSFVIEFNHAIAFARCKIDGLHSNQIFEINFILEFVTVFCLWLIQKHIFNCDLFRFVVVYIFWYFFPHIQTLSSDRYAVGQGALACECRQDDAKMQHILASIHDESAALACIAERAFMCRLDGGCSTPIGVRTILLPGGVAGVESEAGRAKTITLDAAVLSLDGKKCVSAKLTSLLPSALPASASNKASESITIMTTGRKRPIDAIDLPTSCGDGSVSSAKTMRCDARFCCFSQCKTPCSLLPEIQSSVSFWTVFMHYVSKNNLSLNFKKWGN